MTTIHKTAIGFRIITKGAPDILIEKCNKDYNNGNVTMLSNARISQIKNANKAMAEKALRVLGVAYLDINEIPKTIDSNNIEKNLIFVRPNRNDRPTKRRG